MHLVNAIEVSNEEVVRRLSELCICGSVGEPFPVHIDDLAGIMHYRKRKGYSYAC
jgi:adenylate kinase